MKKIFVIFCVLAAAMNVVAAERFVSFSKGDVCFTEKRGAVVCDKSDWKGVLRAVEDLKEDLRKVTGRCDYPITVGTLGKSKAIDKFAKKNSWLKDELSGKWEKFVITWTDKDGLVIAGSDKRGTIFGVYELSEQLGVSPWYWWADVPVVPRAHVYINKGMFTDGEPAVKYRGIFINDEWPSFGGWALKHFGEYSEAAGKETGINSKMYAHMFELLLRLKANYLWPAMWDSAFNEDDPLTQALADEYGIVMGTSHHEPMMRAHQEYVRRKPEIGAWDYIGNHDKIERFFTEGVERAKDFENIITIGMRGDGDVALGSSDEECIEALKTIVAGQRNIIEKVYGKPASEVPQLWAIFTEVQRYYDAGLTVPDDVTLLFCDNNWGYIRRTGPEKERGRKGGMGLYYHIDMNGGPWNDRWVNTTTVAKLREQLWLAYSTGIDRIWIINVGDLKPKEMPIDFIMRYAWNPEAVGPNDCERWMEDWARNIFGAEHAREIAEIVTEYSKLNLERKPEVQHVGIYNKEEAEAMMARWSALEKRTVLYSANIDFDYRDSYEQLVQYPVVGSAAVAKIYLYATLAVYEPEKEQEYREKMQELFERDRLLTRYYNGSQANGKWDGMMQDKHIGYTQWSMPAENSLEPIFEQMKRLQEEKRPVLGEPTVGGRRESQSIAESSEIGIMAHDFSRKTAAKDGTEWIFLPGLGRGKGNMGVWPVTAESRPDGDGATLEYDIELNSRNSRNSLTEKNTPSMTEKDVHLKTRLALGILPTNDINPARGLRIGVKVDDGEMQTIDARQGYVDTFNEYTPQNIARSNVLKPLPNPASDIYLSGWGKPMRNEIFDNLRWLSIDLTDQWEKAEQTNPGGKHTFKIVMIDPEIVIEKLVFNPDNSHYSYYGK